MSRRFRYPAVVKVNFWQLLGIVLMVVGLIWVIYRYATTPTPVDVPATLESQATDPAT